VISGTWAAFARTGSPENGALPDWPAYTPDGRATMILDSECRLVPDPDRDARLLWERIANRG
jgi:para-nitrobenzyl esterase